MTSNGYHGVFVSGVLNVNGVIQDAYNGGLVTGAGWSHEWFGPTVTVALNGSTWVQGQGTIYIDNHLYGGVFSKSIYAG
ncbi:hypothetical protein [Streptomyces sp. NRRL WC-3742]|uniref:hypothetical protein n=1 Tax=Streptomyces sp. NRRL WC-3742 TaxID=1463934 RepID=UPI00131CC189|nr:hypothetical protein [Streptomyces sp. NRRL WC-3742]